MTDDHPEGPRMSRKIVIDLDKNSEASESHDEKYALEMKPVLQAVQAYARRTYALGTLHGASALDILVERISRLENRSAELDAIVEDAKDISEKFRSCLKYP